MAREPASSIAVVHEASDGRCQRLRILRRAQRAVAVVNDEVQQAADRRCDDGNTRCERFDRRQPERFEMRRLDDDVRAAHEGGDIVDRSEKPDRGRRGMLLNEGTRGDADVQKAIQLEPGSRGSFEENASFTKNWIQYLREIQKDREYANWSRPPLDAYTSPH